MTDKESYQNGVAAKCGVRLVACYNLACPQRKLCAHTKPHIEDKQCGDKKDGFNCQCEFFADETRRVNTDTEAAKLKPITRKVEIPNGLESTVELYTCTICGIDHPREEMKHLPLYVIGSEGIFVCDTCRLSLTRHAEELKHMAGKCRLAGYKACKNLQERR